MLIFRVSGLSRLIEITNNFKQFRPLSFTSTLHLKQIEDIKQDNNLVINAKIVPSERELYLLKSEHPTVCPVCALGLDIKHTDVLILSQFVRSDGCMLPRRITGLCKKQQKKMSTLVTMAHKAGLIPNLKPATSHKDPKKRFQWKKFNKYFDESTIKFK